MDTGAKLHLLSLSNIPDSSATTDGSSINRLLRIIRGYNYSGSHDVSCAYTFSAGDHIRPRNFSCDTNTDFFYRRRCTLMQCAQQHTLTSAIIQYMDQHCCHFSSNGASDSCSVTNTSVFASPVTQCAHISTLTLFLATHGYVGPDTDFVTSPVSLAIPITCCQPCYSHYIYISPL